MTIYWPISNRGGNMQKIITFYLYNFYYSISYKFSRTIFKSCKSYPLMNNEMKFFTFFFFKRYLVNYLSEQENGQLTPLDILPLLLCPPTSPFGSKRPFRSSQGLNTQKISNLFLCIRIRSLQKTLADLVYSSSNFQTKLILLVFSINRIEC